jgi:hypothetical protein
MYASLGEIAQAVGAGVLVFNCWQTWRNGRKSKRIEENVKVIEIATNSMKDALVAATAKASLAEGTAAGLQQGRDEPRPGDKP